MLLALWHGRHNFVQVLESMGQADSKWPAKLTGAIVSSCDTAVRHRQALTVGLLLTNAAALSSAALGAPLPPLRPIAPLPDPHHPTVSWVTAGFRL